MPQYIILDKNTNTDCFRLDIPENVSVTSYRISSDRVCDNGLANREIPYIYTSAAREIGAQAFANTGIERLFLSKNITKLGNGVFSSTEGSFANRRELILIPCEKANIFKGFGSVTTATAG